MTPSYREKWKRKAIDVGNFLESAGKPLELLLSRYVGTRFVDGMDRGKVFSEIFSANPSSRVIEYLAERCTDGFGHFRGDRSGAEYAADLIISWIQEDAILLLLEEREISVELDGTDRNREFLPGTKVSATSDFILNSSKRRRKLEVAYDSTGYWRRQHKFDLRDSKFNKLCSEGSIVLGIEIMTTEGFVLDLSKKLTLEVQHIPFHFTYKKPAKSILGIDRLLVPLGDALNELVLQA